MKAERIRQDPPPLPPEIIRLEMTVEEAVGLKWILAYSVVYAWPVQRDYAAPICDAAVDALAKALNP